jgi:hypothetical protein
VPSLAASLFAHTGAIFDPFAAAASPLVQQTRRKLRQLFEVAIAPVGKPE